MARLPWPGRMPPRPPSRRPRLSTELSEASYPTRAIEAAGLGPALGAQVQAAQAALSVLDVQIGKLTITAPVDGVVMTLVFQPGEIAAPGRTLLMLGQTR